MALVGTGLISLLDGGMPLAPDTRCCCARAIARNAFTTVRAAVASAGGIGECTHQLIVHAADVRLKPLDVRRDRPTLFHELLESVVKHKPVVETGSSVS